MDFSIYDPVGDAALYLAGVCAIIGIIAFVAYEVWDSAGRRKEKSRK